MMINELILLIVHITLFKLFFLDCSAASHYPTGRADVNNMLLISKCIPAAPRILQSLQGCKKEYVSGLDNEET